MQEKIAQIVAEKNKQSGGKKTSHRLSKAKWISTGTKVSVRQLGKDGKFHVVQRTTYVNDKYPNELRISKDRNGKRIFVTFVPVN